jgi:hypothetical protein
MDKYKVGDTVWWNRLRGTVIAVDPGEYGERVTFKTAKDTVISTSPGLDPAWGVQSPMQEE